MQLYTCFFFAILTPFLYAQHNSFAISINTPELGLCDFEFYKYSTRSSTQQVFTWDGVTLTPYTPGPIRTYRGRITNQPNYKAFAVWYPDGEVYIHASNGKGENNSIEPLQVDTSNVTITPLNLPVVLFPNKSTKSIKSGYSCTYPEVMSAAKGAGDYETLVAMWENGVNLVDYSFTRDMGFSITTDLLIIPTDSSIATKNDIIKPSDYLGQINAIPMFWKSTGNAAGGATKKDFCSASFKGGRASFTRSSMPSLHHELGHTLGMKHHQNQRDGMSGNSLYYGRNSVYVGTEHLANNLCLSDSSAVYLDVVHPFISRDYAMGEMNTSVNIDVLSNDRDYNGDLLSIYSFDHTSSSGGSITQMGNTLEYTPPSNFVGRDYFSYTGQSGMGGGFFTNEAEVLIDVRSPCSLALHYSFEENTGVQIADSAWQISNHNAVLNNADFTNNSISGVVGNAINLPAQEAILMQDALDPLLGDLSLSLWFKLSEFPKEGQKSILFDSGARGGLFNEGLSIMLDDNGLHFQAQTESIDHAGAQLDYTDSLALQQWYHIVMVVDRTLDSLKAYVNGVELTYSESNNIDFDAGSIIKGYPGFMSASEPSKNRTATTLGVKSAQKQDKFLHNFNGALDEFKIFTSALTEAEVLGLYTTPADHTIGAYGCNNGLKTERAAAQFEAGFKIYPNPSNGLVWIESNSLLKLEKISVYSSMGKVVYVSNPRAATLALDLGHLKAGVYAVEVYSENNLRSLQKISLY